MPGKLVIRLLIYVPSGVDPKEWTLRLSEKVTREVDVDRVLDSDGEESLRLGFKTSGECLIYDPNDVIRFGGGLTLGRGVGGDGDGGDERLDQIVTWLATKSVDRLGLPVYGCRLMDP